jgi:ubiquinone/menaquinone biosynthesis C-methylase UbiE
MSDPKQDCEIERRRYNARAEQALAAAPLIGPDGAAGVDFVLRRPYLVFEDLVHRTVQPGCAVLDLCCGDGIHSLTAARLGARVTASDLAEKNLIVTQTRADRAGLPITTLVADAENLPLPDSSFDLVTCVGSLSYLDLDQFIRETRRLLRPGGTLIFVDSLNHNPIYRFNRYLHYLRGRRSRSTLLRMPTLATLERIRAAYPDLAVSFHGIFSFLAPVLLHAGRERGARWLDLSDKTCGLLKRYAFKIVGVGHRPRE